MGGSSGGGGSSGSVSYPEYMQTMHGTWLTAVAADMVIAQTGDNPYTAAVAYDPDCVLSATNYIISLFYDEVVAATPGADWSTYFDSSLAKYTAETITAITAYDFTDPFSDANIDASITAYQTDLEARRDADFKPAYKVGMLNVNAVMSSSFVLADALITAEVARNVSKFSADLYFQNEEKKLKYEELQASENTAHNKNIIARDNLIVMQTNSRMTFASAASSDIISKELQILDFFRLLGHLTAEVNRVKLVAKQEETETNVKYDERDSLWDLEIYQHGNNVLASIAGAASATKGAEVSTGASVLGGAMSGAAMGANPALMAATGGMSVPIGAVLGGLGGLLS